MTALGSLALVAVTEWIVRAKVMPNDERFTAHFELFLTAEATNAAFGDSRMESAFYGDSVGGTEFVNLAMGGENIPTTEAKVRSYFRDRQPGHVILQADPHMLSSFRDSNVVPGDISPFTNRTLPPLRMLTGKYRKFLLRYWQLFLTGGSFTHGAELEISGTWADNTEDERRAFVQRQLPFQTPAQDFQTSESYRAFERTLEYLGERGANVCLVTMPVTPMHLERVSAIPLVVSALETYRDLATEHAFFYVDMSDGYDQLALFENSDHLNSTGATRFSPAVELACFPSQMEGTIPRKNEDI